jgi:hypothetical protein
MALNSGTGPTRPDPSPASHGPRSGQACSPIADEIIERWAARRDELKRLGAKVDGALLCEEVIADLRSIADAQDSETLTLAEASRRSGYSPDHLSRLIRRGILTNAGRKHKPMLLAGELPRRTTRVAAQRPAGYDPNTDARSLRVRR